MLVENIRALCAEKRISIAALERSVGLGNGVIARWDESSPRLESVLAVANYFGVSVNQLLGTGVEAGSQCR